MVLNLDSLKSHHVIFRRQNYRNIELTRNEPESVGILLKGGGINYLPWASVISRQDAKLCSGKPCPPRAGAWATFTPLYPMSIWITTTANSWKKTRGQPGWQTKLLTQENHKPREYHLLTWRRPGWQNRRPSDRASHHNETMFINREVTPLLRLASRITTPATVGCHSEKESGTHIGENTWSSRGARCDIPRQDLRCKKADVIGTAWRQFSTVPLPHETHRSALSGCIGCDRNCVSKN